MDLLNIDLPGQPTPGGSSETLERNLKALAATSPDAAKRIQAALPRLGVEIMDTDEDGLGLVVDGATIASKRRPITEADRFADTAKISDTAAVAVLGFGAGHHCRVLCERMKGQGVVLCCEPDVELLRVVLSRVDITGWLSQSRFVLLTDPTDKAAISAGLAGLEGVIAMGVKLIEHPPSRARLKDSAPAFADSFTEVLNATRTQVATTLLQSERTLRNLLMNVDRYAGADGIADLLGAAAGRPAVLVAAGPSLHRNLDQLAEPGVRDRVVIIAVQTVLRPMLAAGIKPHFVTALDYHEISARFYEGLSAADVQGVTLVADPKVNPAVLSAWPGAVRLIASDLLDGILSSGGGPAAAPKGELKPGATVAHLSHYLARAIGCDPVILIGQDLGFTGGLYYGPRAAIHDTWAAELGPFRTLEQLEWERIARHKKTLRTATDTAGRPVYTDAQMISYLAQFEVDFAEDEARGWRVIDATQGGVAKKRTLAMPLHEALQAFAGQTHEPLPAARPQAPASQSRDTALARVRVVRAQADRIAQRSRTTAGCLGDMLKHHGNQNRVNRLITQVNTIRDEVLALAPGWQLVDFINQSGVLSRIKADRKIIMDSPADPMAKQRAQIDRDTQNVQQVADAAEHLSRLLGQAAAMLEGTGPRLTRDTVIAPEADSQRETSAAEISVQSRGRVEAMIPVDCDYSGLGTRRDLARPVWRDANALRLTVGRLLLTEQLDGITLLAGEPERVASLLGALANNPKVCIEPLDAERLRTRTRLLGKARLFGAASWRGGVAGLTCYDEALDPEALAPVMDKRRVTAAFVCGPDWSLIDPKLADDLIARHRESPERVPLAFTQAAPGLAGLLIDRATVGRLAAAQPTAGALATLGGLLAYIPSAPAGDPIATHACVAVDPIVRDCGRRGIADSSPGIARVAAVLGSIGANWIEADATRIADELRRADHGGTVPQRLELEACTGRLSGALVVEPAERPVLTMRNANRVLRQLAEGRTNAAVTLGGAGDPLGHPGALGLIQLAGECGVPAVHVRTELLHRVNLAELLDAGPSVISVDLHARTPESYHTITGVDRHAEVLQSVQALLKEARARGAFGLPSCWIVPRLTRRDAVLDQIPDWYDGVLTGAQCAVIDPAPRLRDEQTTPLPLPSAARARLSTEGLTLRSDLSIDELGEPLCERLGLDEAWRRVQRCRRAALVEIESKSNAQNLLASTAHIGAA
ncbi:MAG: hypothetical protein ACI89L_000649 [Phycisphaerales bacterium]|jgi:hypothetical protein